MIESEAYAIAPRRNKTSRHVSRKKKKEAAIARRNIRLAHNSNHTNLTHPNNTNNNDTSHPHTTTTTQQRIIPTHTTNNANSTSSTSKKWSFPGRHKWLGGAVDDETGKIYGVPSHSHHIICITPPPPPHTNDHPTDGVTTVTSTDTTKPQTTATTTTINTPPPPTMPTIELISLPNHDTKIKEGNFKWLRGIITDGHLYGIPAWSNHGVLKVRLRSEGPAATADGEKQRIIGPRVKLLPLPNPAAAAPESELELESNKSSCQKSVGNDEGYDDYDHPITTTQKSNAIMERGDTTSTTTINPTSSGKKTYTNSIDRTRWMWHGGALGHRHTPNDNTNNNNANDIDNTDTAIYCIPSNADHVLKIHIPTEAVTEIGPKLRGQNKWYGGIRGKDGCIYGMPYAATGVIRINPRNDSVEILGSFPAGGYKWHGGLLAHSTGMIYAFPAHANEVLCVDTNVNRPCITGNTHSNDNFHKEEQKERDDANHQSWRVHTIPIRRHPEDTDSPGLQYKWLGGAYGADGCIYGMPSDATSILRIDPVKDEATTFAKLSDTKNKWQGGVLSPIDKCVYAVPADSDCILRIDTDPDTPLKVDTTIGTEFLSGSSISSNDLTDKWQGGFLARDGNIYGIPENFDRVMKLTPGEKPNLDFLF